MLLNSSACQTSAAYNIIDLIRAACTKTFVALRAEAGGSHRESLSDNYVRRAFTCRTFFPKAA